MGTHAAAGDEPLTSKVHTHCRYRHRQHLGPSSPPGCGSRRDPGCLGGSGDTDGSPQPWWHRGGGRSDVALLRTPGCPGGMLGSPRKGHGDPKTLGKPRGGRGELRQGCRAAGSPRRNPGHPTLGTPEPLIPRASHAAMLSPRRSRGTHEPHAGNAAPPHSPRRNPGHPTQGTLGTLGRCPHAGDTRTGAPHAGDTEDAAPEHPPHGAPGAPRKH